MPPACDAAGAAEPDLTFVLEAPRQLFTIKRRLRPLLTHSSSEKPVFLGYLLAPDAVDLRGAFPAPAVAPCAERGLIPVARKHSAQRESASRDISGRVCSFPVPIRATLRIIAEFGMLIGISRRLLDELHHAGILVGIRLEMVRFLLAHGL